MYIELFLIDNLLMNLLIMRLAAALLAVRPPLYRQTAAIMLNAAYAALAAYRFPAMAGIWPRPLLLMIMASAIPFRSPKGFLISCGAVLSATFAVGGAACCIAFMEGGGLSGGFVRGGIALRSALISAGAASAAPRAVRLLIRRRLRGTVEVRLIHGGLERRCEGLIDTGSSLVEPMSGLPVVTVRGRALKRYAALPIRAATAAGEIMLPAFRPDKLLIDGVPVSAFVAVTEANIKAEAIVPPELCANDRS